MLTTSVWILLVDVNAASAACSGRQHPQTQKAWALHRPVGLLRWHFTMWICCHPQPESDEYSGSAWRGHGCGNARFKVIIRTPDTGAVLLSLRSPAVSCPDEWLSSTISAPASIRIALMGLAVMDRRRRRHFSSSAFCARMKNGR